MKQSKMNKKYIKRIFFITTTLCVIFYFWNFSHINIGTRQSRLIVNKALVEYDRKVKEIIVNSNDNDGELKNDIETAVEKLLSNNDKIDVTNFETKNISEKDVDEILGNSDVNYASNLYVQETRTNSIGKDTGKTAGEINVGSGGVLSTAKGKQFEFLLSKYAIDHLIILAVTDLGFVEMAENLYVSSFKKFNISNYLFVCSHEKAEQYLKSRNIHAISLWNDSLSTKESIYSTPGYRNKTNFKTDSVNMSLGLGYNTLLVDVDIVFLQNPLPYLMQYSTTYDLIIQGGYQSLNSGFYLATNRGAAKEMHERMCNKSNRYRTHGGGGNQVDMNHIIKKVMKERIQVKVLPRDLFPWGGYYFSLGGRQFAGDNRTIDPIIVHNNVLSRKDFGFGSKRYRFREHLMWHLDHNRYYSSPDQKYVTFEFPVGMRDRDLMRKTLTTAFIMASLMNRTLILPKFYCTRKRGSQVRHCNYQSCLGRVPFPLDIYEGLYREHMFLHHPLVPQSVKQSQSEIINVETLVPKDSLDQTNTDTMLQALKAFAGYSVIRLENLHKVMLQNRFQDV